MKSYLPDFELVSPKTLNEALAVMANQPGARPLAGGTDLMVQLDNGTLKPGLFVDLQAVAELSDGVRMDGGAHLGAMTTFRSARQHPELVRRYPMLATAAREVGVLAIQARGTWAGNIANASPAADGVPALMVYRAQVELQSAEGKRVIPLADFYTGYKQMNKKSNELITDIQLPAPPPRRFEYYRKVGARRFQAISKVLLAAWIVLEKDQVVDISLSLGSVAPHTLRVRNTEALLTGKTLTPGLMKDARDSVHAEVSPIDDIRSTAAYRRTVAANLVVDFLTKVLAQGGA
jgi:CO/xanthine dehydrogenase FAD-binding subunit